MTNRQSLREAIAPLVEMLGAEVVELELATKSDVILEWDGDPAVAVRLDFASTIAAQVRSVEQELGGRLADLGRSQKQAAVRILDERGAFNMRRAIEDVADAMGVSRITIYNYLNAIRRSR